MPGTTPSFKQPKILRGAFVEYESKNKSKGKNKTPPLIVNFQFNPLTISRDRANAFAVPGKAQKRGWGKEPLSLRQYHQRYNDLLKLRDQQSVKVNPETITFDIRLDATDALNEGDQTAQDWGIAPQLSTLELMMHPKGESLVKKEEKELLKPKSSFSFTGLKNPPMILFVWGMDKVLPVNLTSIRIREEEFDAKLDPTRAIVTVSLTVIEGPTSPYLFSKKRKEMAAEYNLSTMPEVVEVFIPEAKSKTKSKPKKRKRK